jgi:hypothetical protein
VSAYDEQLPPAFPYLIIEKESVVKEYIRTLVGWEDDYVNGTSFAVTSDAMELGHRKLWLSYWSYVRLSKIYGEAFIGRCGHTNTITEAR